MQIEENNHMQIKLNYSITTNDNMDNQKKKNRNKKVRELRR